MESAIVHYSLIDDNVCSLFAERRFDGLIEKAALSDLGLSQLECSFMPIAVCKLAYRGTYFVPDP